MEKYENRSRTFERSGTATSFDTSLTINYETEDRREDAFDFSRLVIKHSAFKDSCLAIQLPASLRYKYAPGLFYYPLVLRGSCAEPKVRGKTENGNSTIANVAADVELKKLIGPLK